MTIAAGCGSGVLGGRRKPSPLFPLYLFAQLDPGPSSPDVWRWTPGLSAAVRVGEAYAIVADAVVERTRAGLLRMQQRPCPLRRGERVRVVGDHPLAMLDAVFERPLSGGARRTSSRCWVGSRGARWAHVTSRGCQLPVGPSDSRWRERAAPSEQCLARPLEHRLTLIRLSVQW